MSPEIIDVQTNRRCGRTQEFGRLLKKESKRRLGGRKGNKWVEDYETKTGEKSDGKKR